MAYDPKKTKSLQIFKDEVVVATLLRTVDGAKVEALPKALQSGFDGRLTYCMDLRNSPYEIKGVNLPPYFAGLLPEGLRLRAVAKRIKTSEDDLFSILIASGYDPIGDLSFKLEKSKGKKQNGIPKSFQALRAEIKSGGDQSGVPLAGVQEKMSADRISLPIATQNEKGSYILKFGSDLYPDVAANEFACLSLAKKCGLEVSSAKIIQDKNNEKALLVVRFDRKWDSQSKSLRRLHMEDACQFLDRYPSDKYLISVQEIAERIQNLVETPQIEILNLLRQLAFSYLVGNGDLHAKNLSLLREGDGGANRLSPAYDIVCTAIYGDDKMALQFNGRNKNWKRKLFIEFGERYGLSSKLIETMLDRLLKAFLVNKGLLFAIPLAQQKQTFLEGFLKQRIKHLS